MERGSQWKKLKRGCFLFRFAGSAENVVTSRKKYMLWTFPISSPLTDTKWQLHPGNWFKIGEMCGRNHHSMDRKDIVTCHVHISGHGERMSTYFGRIIRTALTLAVLAQGDIDCEMFVTSNRCSLVENTLIWSTVVSCACELVLFFLLCSVWLNLCVNWTPGSL